MTNIYKVYLNEDNFIKCIEHRQNTFTTLRESLKGSVWENKETLNKVVIVNIMQDGDEHYVMFKDKGDDNPGCSELGFEDFSDIFKRLSWVKYDRRIP